MLLPRGEPRASRAAGVRGVQSFESVDRFVSGGSCAGAATHGGHELPRLGRRDQRRGLGDVGLLQSAHDASSRARRMRISRCNAGTLGSVNQPPAPRAAAEGRPPSGGPCEVMGARVRPPLTRQIATQN